jgi:hypothetical protein
MSHIDPVKVNDNAVQKYDSWVKRPAEQEYIYFSFILLGLVGKTCENQVFFPLIFL